MLSTPKSSRWGTVGIVVAVLFCICLVAALLVSGGLYYIYRQGQAAGGIQSFVVSPQPTVELNRPTVGAAPQAAEDTLRTMVVPDSDPYDLACRLLRTCNVPTTLPAPSTPFKLGDRRQFWIQNQDTSQYYQVDTTLRNITPHSYFWVQDGVAARDSDIAALMTTFENKIYPTDRRFFGSEWTPGVDNDPHIYVLYVSGIGRSTAGFFSPFDEFNPLALKHSNGAELFVFNADSENLADEYAYGTLAHEFQHMIHWHLDRNESSWLNEGFSELAAFLNGYSVGAKDYVYVRQPDIPLLDWTSLSDSPSLTGAHYGQSFLFVTYFLDRFGEGATQAVVKDAENSLASIDDVLQRLGITDPQTGYPITADDVVMDWMDALYLHDGAVGDGRYTFHNYPGAPRTSASQQISTCPHSLQNGSVSQYGAEYIEITCSGEHVISFTGSTVVKVLPTQPHSGKVAFWSNKGDSSDMTLTRTFDLTSASGAVQMSYWTWYDIEAGYDFLYLEASTDGQHWAILKTPSCTDQDSSVNSYGCGYTARSGGGDLAQWIHETVDLSSYAGKSVQLRFEYVTDATLNGEGLLLDDLSIPAINYSTDFETDDGSWDAKGFALIDNSLPQTFRISLIVESGGKTTVSNVPVAADQTATIPISLASGGEAVVVITGTQRFTRLPAGYTIVVK